MKNKNISKMNLNRVDQISKDHVVVHSKEEKSSNPNFSKSAQYLA